MFRRILLVFTDPELRSKLIKIMLLLIAARFLAHIPIPVLRTQDISPIIDSDAALGLLNTISGGAYGQLSFVMLGVGPYITASIVIQLLGVIVPKIQEIQKEEGEAGQQKINRWTRFLAVPLAALQAWGILQFLSSSNAQGGQQIELPAVLRSTEITTESFAYWFAVIAAMTAGSIIMMWIGEIITEYKMGNGVSLMILSGIIVRLPGQIYNYGELVFPNVRELFSKFSFEKVGNWEVWKAFLWDNPTWAPTRNLFLLLFSFVSVLLLVVFVNDAVRKLVVIYSRRGHTEGKSRTLGTVKADLPIKVNIAGVLPIIFAVSFILFPTILSRFFFTSNLTQLRNTAQQIERYLSTELDFNARATGNLPNRFLGVYNTSNPEEILTAENYDTTEGQELFGFTLTTLKVEYDYTLPENPSEEDRQKEAAKELKNVLFDGTFLRFELPSSNLGFLPEFAIRWNGILAYTFFYFLLIVFFTYFYTSTVAFKTDDVAENLQRSGAYIPGFRPGLETQEYLSYVSNRLNVAGSIFLAVIAIIPFLFNNTLNFGDGTLNGIVGGTTLLILVSVTIEVLRAIEAQATSIDYERFTKY
ncbi:MAG: preprotein translocase subunit SecY [Patescibacteria group bacterium]